MLARQEYVSDGHTMLYPIGFSMGYLRKEYVHCQVEGETNERSLTWNPNNDGFVTINGAAISAGKTITLFRVMPKTDFLYWYEDGSPLSDVALDEMNLQLMMSIHELIDDIDTININFENLETVVNQLVEFVDGVQDRIQELTDMIEQAQNIYDRIEDLIGQAEYNSAIYNLSQGWIADKAYAAGAVITLPAGMIYYPTRNVLTMSVNGMACYPNVPGLQAAGEYQFTEIGTDPNTASTTFTVNFAVAAGDVFWFFVVSSAAGRNIDLIQSIADSSQELLEQAQEQFSDTQTYVDSEVDSLTDFVENTMATSVQTVNSIAANADQDVQVTYYVTMAEYATLDNAGQLVPGAMYVRTDAPMDAISVVAVVAAQPNTIPLRGATGTLQTAAPVVDNDAVRLVDLNTAVANAGVPAETTAQIEATAAQVQSVQTDVSDIQTAFSLHVNDEDIHGSTSAAPVTVNAVLGVRVPNGSLVIPDDYWGTRSVTPAAVLKGKSLIEGLNAMCVGEDIYVSVPKLATASLVEALAEQEYAYLGYSSAQEYIDSEYTYVGQDWYTRNADTPTTRTLQEWLINILINCIDYGMYMDFPDGEQVYYGA